jgi:hypothetical protein
MRIDVECGESPMSENQLTPTCSSISGAQRRRPLIPVDCIFLEEQTRNKQKKKRVSRLTSIIYVW